MLSAYSDGYVPRIHLYFCVILDKNYLLMLTRPIILPQIIYCFHLIEIEIAKLSTKYKNPKNIKFVFYLFQIRLFKTSFIVICKAQNIINTSEKTNSKQNSNSSQHIIFPQMKIPILITFTTIMVLALMPCCLCQYPKRILTESLFHFNRYIFYYNFHQTGPALTNYYIPSDIQTRASLKDMDIHHTSTINSFSSNQGTFGFDLDIQLTLITSTNILISIPYSSLNQRNSAQLWYTISFLIFIAPKNSPISVQKYPFQQANPGSNADTIHYSSGRWTFHINPIFRSGCYWDKQKTIKDHVQIFPSITKVNIQNSMTIQLSSPFNWKYNSKEQRPNLLIQIKFKGYLTVKKNITLSVIGACPNSYLFTNVNYTFSFSALNYFVIPADTNGTVQERPIVFTTPLTNSTDIMMGLSFISLTLQEPNITSTFTSFNISNSYDQLGQLQQNQGILKFKVDGPNPWAVNYWAIGLIGNCPINFNPFNKTHCFCNSSLNLTYDPIYSTLKCRKTCLSGQHFNYNLQDCTSCKITYSFLCSTCNSTHCFNCTNGLQYYLNHTSVFCLNCTLDYGNKCRYCSNSQCLDCSSNYRIGSAGECTCSGDRYLDNTTTCVFCHLNFENCVNCTETGCLVCSKGFVAVQGTCACPSPKLLLNGFCRFCSQIFGEGCLRCSSGCTLCQPGFSLSYSYCFNCTALHNVNCINCDRFKCKACGNNFMHNYITYQCQCYIPYSLVIDGICQPCRVLFPGCFTCNSSTCLACLPSYDFNNSTCSCPVGTFSNGISCQPCSQKDPFCLQCDSQSCLQCPSLFLLSNGTCLCSGDRFLNNNSQCIMCSLLGCSQCQSQSICLICKENFTLGNGSCQCAQNYILNGTQCILCEVVHGQSCLTCSDTECLSCGFNFNLFNGLCECPPPSSAIISNYCQLCSDSFPFCQTCNSSNCLSCKDSHHLINGNCQCQIYQYQSLSEICTNCSQNYTNCQSCSWDRCTLCSTNFSMINQECLCSSPLVQVIDLSTTRCLACQDTANPEECTLKVEVEYYQGGNYFFFKLVFSKPQQNIIHLLPLNQNMKVTINNKTAAFHHLHSDIYYLSLQKIKKEIEINITILHQSYIFYNNLFLTNQPSIIHTHSVEQLVFSQQALTFLWKMRNYINIGMVTLCFATFNHMFEQSSLLSFLAFTKKKHPNSLGIVLHSANQHNIYFPLPLSIPLENRTIQTSNINTQVYNMNKPIAHTSFQLIFLTLCGSFLIIYVINYLKSKRNPTRHKAFRNILGHSSEYLIQNWFSLFSVLSFPLFYQVKLALNNGLDDLEPSNGFNLVLSLCLLLANFFLIPIYICKFPPKSKRYSVLYLELKSQKALVVLSTLLSLLRPYIISPCIIFLQFPISQYLILTYTFIHLFFLIICAPLHLNIISYIFTILKLLIGTFINLVLLLTQEDTLIARIAAYLFILLIFVESIEVFFKLIRLVLRNKGFIDDHQPIELSDQDVQEQQQEKKKKLTNQMLSFLSKARNELGQILKKKKQRQND